MQLKEVCGFVLNDFSGSDDVLPCSPQKINVQVAPQWDIQMHILYACMSRAELSRSTVEGFCLQHLSAVPKEWFLVPEGP